MTEMKFNSQICTSREQSERLLAIGLKKETSDMALVENWDWSEEYGQYFTGEYFERPIDYVEGMRDRWIPAWSLHRLIEMCPYYIEFGEKVWVLMVNHSDVQYKVTGGCSYIGSFIGTDLYTNLIDCIEWLIKEGYFNKEYLV